MRHRPLGPAEFRVSLFELELSFAARRPWVPRRAEFLLWATAAWAAVGLSPRQRRLRSGLGGVGARARLTGSGGISRDERVLLEIRVVGGAASRRLNARYREKDHPTNVLSFAGAGLSPEGRHLGELVICAPVMEAEARRLAGGGDAPSRGRARSARVLRAAAVRARRAHWAHITVHGVLHLAGFDHERPAAALKMEALEIQILDRLGFSDPYA